jgi:ATP-dependent Lon protease
MKQNNAVMKKESEEMFIKLKAVIKIQNRFRYIRSSLNKINMKLIKVQNHLFNMIEKVQNNYELGIISKTRYDILLMDIDDIKNIYDKTPNVPITISSLENVSIMSIQVYVSYINQKIYELSQETGTYNVSEMLDILVGDEWCENVSQKYIENIIFFDKNLNIFKTKIINDQEEIEDIVQLAKNDNNNYPFELPFSSRSYPFITKSFVEKIFGLNLYIPVNDYFIKITGIVKQDPLNICMNNRLWSNKYDVLKKSIDYLKLPKDFKDKFIDQLSLRDFLVYTDTELVTKVKNSYTALKKIQAKTISDVVKDFMKSSLEKQRVLLILLLLSEKNDQFLAHIIYDMISNPSNLLKSQLNSDKIYQTLHWSLQRIFKIVFKSEEKNIERLKNLSVEDIPFEKRIYLMKTSEKVKKKAFDKLRESSGSRESSVKAQQYLEGLLDIPFGIYKKEQILQFLDDFKNNIDSSLSSIKGKIDKLKSDKLDGVFNEIFKYNSFTTYESVNKFIKFIKNELNNLSKILNNFNDVDKIKSIDTLTVINPIINAELLDNTISKLKKITEIRKALVDNNVKNLDNLLRIENELITIQNDLGLNDIDEEDNNNDINSSEYEILLESINLLNKLISDWDMHNKNKKKYLENIRDTLDESIYGHKESKLHIERVLGQWMNGKMKGTIFGFCGPPGTGKTTLAKYGLSKCLVDDDGNSRPFCFLPLGGTSNGSMLQGHSYTYLGSTWGRIVDLLIESKCMNPIIFIDEVDKISKTEAGREIIGILTHLTDLSQNQEFMDKYFAGIPIDVSKIIFVFSYNNRNLVDRILLDRITEIEIKPLSKNEKIKIAKNYLMPEILDTVGYNKEDIIISKSDLVFIIESYTYEAGVRKLKEKLFEIIRDINLRKIMGEDISIPYTIKREVIEDIFSEKSKVRFKKIAKEPLVGMVNGLYATASGTGGLTLIEVHKTLTDRKLDLELTGQQGDVMKESMKCAKTLAWNLIPVSHKKKINEEWEDIGTYGLHIHCPECATPKDGPSAGAAITCAIISRLTNTPIRNTVALTGEIDLNGNVHVIGGVDSKVDGAKRAGVTKVLLPHGNKEDYEKYVKKLEDAMSASIDSNVEDHSNENYVDDIEVVFVKTIHEVLKHILVDNDIMFNTNI